MGSACCVAAKDKTIANESISDNLQSNTRYSPAWSFQWDNNRGQVAGDDTSISWLSDGVSRNDGSYIKSESAYLSEEESPIGSVERSAWSKSPFSEGNAIYVRTPTSDCSISRNASNDISLEQVKESIESPAVSYQSPRKPSLSFISNSSWTASPLSSQSHLNLASLTPSRCAFRSPGHRLIRQVSDSRILRFKSPNSYSISEERPVLPPWSAESTRGYCDGSSDGWSLQAFSERMATSYKERLSTDSESVRFNLEKITRSSSRILASPPVDLQSCRICSKFLSENSLWSGQKIMGMNELSVVSVLICGHVYHAECLDGMTPDVNKYDPMCPVCIFGEKRTLKLSEKALRAQLDLKTRNIKKSRKRVSDSDLSCDSINFNRFKGSEHEVKGLKMGSSSIMKSTFAKPFLRHRFSFSSKGCKSIENHTTKKKGFFWAKSNCE